MKPFDSDIPERDLYKDYYESTKYGDDWTTGEILEKIKEKEEMDSWNNMGGS